MTDHDKYVKTHELYNKFCQWLGVSNITENTYSMINYSLYTAESYIRTQYGIIISLDTFIHSVANNGSFIFPFTPTKIINMFKDGKACYPTITYLDSTDYLIKTEQGDYFTDLSNKTLSGLYTSIYLVGYVNKVTVPNVDLLYNEYKLNPPQFEINNVSITSPFTVYTDTFDLTIIGEKDNKVIVDNEEVGTIDENGKFVLPISLNKQISTFNVKFTNSDGSKDSNTINLIFILSNKIPTPSFHVLGYTTRVNTKNILVSVAKPAMSNLSYKINGVLTNLDDSTNTSNIAQFTIPFDTSNDNEKIIIELYITKDGKQSQSKFIMVDYNKNLSSDYITTLNKDVLTVPYLPENLMIGLFKLAKHFYTGTLYNNSNIDKYRTSPDIGVTYISHTIPKDILSLLSGFISYH